MPSYYDIDTSVRINGGLTINGDSNIPSNSLNVGGTITGNTITGNTINAGTFNEGGIALSSKYLGINATAVNSTQFNSLNSNQFVRSDATTNISANVYFTSGNGVTFQTDASDSAKIYTEYDGTVASGSSRTNLVFFVQDDADDAIVHRVKYYNSGNATDVLTLNYNKATFDAGVTAYVGSNVMWHAGNDGAGSGLDADKLDGLDSSNFMRGVSANGFFGLAKADGTTSDWIRTTVNGIIPYASGTGSSLGTSSWNFNAIYGATIYEGNTALSSKYLGITAKASDSDKLDSLDSTQFLRSDVGTTLTGGNDLHLKANSGSTDSGDLVFQQGDGTENSRVYGSPNTLNLRAGNSPYGDLVVTTGNVTFNSNTVWHAGNDGSGSGLDADTLDGLDSLSFVKADGTVHMSGDFNMGGNSALGQQYVVSGGITSDRVNNSTWYGIGRSNIYYGNNSGSSTGVQLGGYFGINLKTSNGELVLDPSYSSAPKYNGNVMWHQGNDGSGSGLDADKIDGLDSTQFLRSDTSTALNGNLTVTGNITATSNISGNHTGTGSSLTVNGTTANGGVNPISNGWAYTHENKTGSMGHIPTGGTNTTFLRGDNTWVTPTDTDTYVNGLSSTAGGNGTLTLSRNTGGNLSLNLSHTHPFSQVTSLPTTLGGYGITDGAPKNVQSYGSISGSTITGFLPLPTLGDKLRWRTPVNVEYYDGTTWQSWSTNAFNALTDGRGNTYANIDYTHATFRLTYQQDAYGVSNNTIYMATAYNAPNGNLTVESGTDLYFTGNVNVRASSIPALGSYWRYANVADFNADTYARFTFNWSLTSGNSFNFLQLMLLTQRPGEQGASMESLLPFSWDINKNITTSGSLTASSVVENGTSLSSKYLGINSTASNSTLFNSLSSNQFIRSDVSSTMNGTLTATQSIILANNVSLMGKNTSGSSISLAWVSNANQIGIGNVSAPIFLNSSSSPVYWDGTTNHTMWHQGNMGSSSGLDADTVDGKHASAFAPNGYGLGTTGNRLSSGSALSSVGASGWYDIQNPSDGVTGMSWHGLLHNETADTNYATQLVFPMVDNLSNPIYVRTKHAGSWNAWNKVWTDQNDGSGSGLDADTVDGLQGTQIVSDTGIVITNQDLNTMTGNGVYRVQNWSGNNIPSGGNGVYSYGTLEIIQTNYSVTQNYYAHNNGQTSGMWTRTKWNASDWSVWKRIWTDNNDGSGSGLDADTVDGIQASQFLRSDTNTTITGGNNISLQASNGSTDSGDLVFLSGDGTENARVYGAPSTMYLRAGGPSGNSILQLSSNSITFNANTVWHKGNQGAGSGLDADTIDGLDSTQFLRADISDTLNGVLTISGSSATPLVLERSSGPNVNMQFVHDNTTTGFLGIDNTGVLKYGAVADLNASGNIVWHQGNDGSGSGLDADLLDGIDSTKFARTDVDSTLSGNITMAVSKSIEFNGNTSANLPASTPTALSYGQLQSYGTFNILADTDGSHTEYIYLSAGYPTGAQNNGLAIGYNLANFTWKGYPIWHSGNMGSNSGLDADKLDGHDSTYFVYNGQNHLFSNMSGGASYDQVDFNSLMTIGEYRFINLGGSGTVNKPTGLSGKGYYFGMGGGDVGSRGFQLLGTDGYQFYFREISNSAWVKVWNDHNDGAGSGLDADTVDSIQASQFVRNDSANQTVNNGFTMSGNAYVGMSNSSGALYIRTGSGSYGIQLAGDNSAKQSGVGAYINASGTATFSGTMTANAIAVTSTALVNNLNAQMVNSVKEPQLTKNQSINEISGKGVYTGLAISAQSVPNMTVQVSTGTAYTDSGMRIVVSSGTSVSFASPSATYDRIDSVYVQGSSAGANEGVITVATGVASSSPVAPTIPSDGVLLANVTIRQNAGSILSTDITDMRVWRPFNTVGTDIYMVGTMHVVGTLDGNTTIPVNKPFKNTPSNNSITISAGSTSYTWTHNLNLPQYIVKLSCNNPEPHVTWSNKTANAITINLDDTYDTDTIVDIGIEAF